MSLPQYHIHCPCSNLEVGLEGAAGAEICCAVGTCFLEFGGDKCDQHMPSTLLLKLILQLILIIHIIGLIFCHVPTFLSLLLMLLLKGEPGAQGKKVKWWFFFFNYYLIFFSLLFSVLG